MTWTRCAGREAGDEPQDRRLADAGRAEQAGPAGGAELDRQWPEERRRRWLKAAGRLYPLRGTREGLRRALLVFLGLDPDGAVRAGFVHYNDEEDARRLVEAVADVAAGSAVGVAEPSAEPPA